MANHVVGTKYVSVNLNKSYGQQSHHHYNHSSGFGSNRARAGGGGGGGMVVLSRPRSSQKAGPKLSVPPPLNLPSLRKEHERIDSLGSSVHSGGGISGTGSRPASSGMGWTKPAATVALEEKERLGSDIVTDNVDGASKRNNGMYIPPVALSGAVEPSASASDRAFTSIEKAAFLRGEDFPSLRATLPATSVSGKKQKEVLNQKQNQVADGESSKEQKDVSRMSSSLVDMRPQSQLGPNRVGNGFGESAGFQDGLRSSEQTRKREEFFPGPLPLVRFNPRSDWADDERDTSHGLRDRDRNQGYSNNESLWDRDFDMPRASLLPHKPAAHNLLDRQGQRESGTGKFSSGEARTPSEGREVNAWRDSSSLPKEVGNDRNGIGARPSSRGREVIKENKYIPSSFRENVRDNSGTRDVEYQHGARQPWNTNTINTSSNRGTFTRDRYGSEQHSRYRADPLQNVSSLGSFSSGGKHLRDNDPILNFGRDKRPFSKSEKPYLEDPFLKDFGDTGFDVRDSFPVLGVVKKKKEALKKTNFHDPVRESFEAELERVQKMQEEERLRTVKEQELAMELARREEEERLRLAREQEERQRRLDEEAREAVWRAEQERLEAVRRAEELKKAKEEEKRRMLMEEERRKQAAKQKLLELEEKIAKRQAEAVKGGSSSSTVAEERSLGIVKEREVSSGVDTVDWEDGERIVERITTSGSLDLPIPNRSFEMSSGSHFSRDSSCGFLDRGKPASSCRKDAFDNGSNSTSGSRDMESFPHSPQRDGGRFFPKKEFFGAAGYMNSRSNCKAGIPEPHMDEFSHPKGQRWNILGEGNHHGRNSRMESELNESLGEQFGEVGWTQRQGHSRPNLYSPYPDRLYQNPEGDDYYPFGRARYQLRQPRVLPPPSLVSMQKSSYIDDADHPEPSTFLENEIRYYPGGIESTAQVGYGGDLQDNLGLPASNRNEEHQLDRKPAPRCDSQSSLSVSSPPDSPIQLSHDDLDESGDSSILSGVGKGKDIALLGKDNEHVSADAREGNGMTATGSVSCRDDEEWTLDNNEQVQEQEEYDEDEDGYREEDEIHEVEEENIDLTQKFEEMHLQEKDSNLVLGFNEGVEVEMPSDDFEKCFRNEEATFTIPQHSVGSTEGKESSNGITDDAQTIQSVEVPAQVNIHGTSTFFLETENAALKASKLFQPVNKVDSLNTSAISSQPTVLPSLNMAPHSSTVQTAMPSALSAPGQTEEPVKLQFGLFSGPSLIPPPVTAIQIGSIQMPLPLTLQVGPSLTHMQSSQPPIFQFGQLRYTTPISQGALPLPSCAFVQPNTPSNFGLNQNLGASVLLQHGQGNAANNLVKSAALSLSDTQSGGVMRLVDNSNGSMLKGANLLPARKSTEIAMSQQKQAEMSGKSESTSREEVQEMRDSIERESEGQLQTDATSPLLVSKGKGTSGSRTRGQVYGGRGKRDVFTVKNSGSRSSGISEVSHVDSSGYRRPQRQRIEFRVRASNQISSGENSNASGRFPEHSIRNWARKIAGSEKCTKHTVESDGSGSGPAASQKMDAGRRSEIGAGKEIVKESQNLSYSGQTNLKRNLISEDDIDVPLQSGIVRVFEQPGIESPSDDDDFIEVRSKRQVLNDRREQREKEIKAKSRAMKVTRKPRSTLHNTVVATRSNETSVVSEVANNKQSNPVTNKQPLAPIGTPSHKADGPTDSKSLKPLQRSALPAVSGAEQNLASSFMFDSKNKVLENIQTSLGSWGSSRADQPVMALTQSQLDEAMKPVSFDSCVSVEDHTSSVTEPNSASTSILAVNKTFPSATGPINSLLAGGKIQFGAVTSSTVLPPGSLAVSHGIGPPGPCRVDLQVSGNLSTSENACSLFFEKEKHLNESSAHNMEDCEAEAEAAASAVAVAAITSDDIGGSALGAGSVSVAETKSFGGAELDDASGSGMAGERSSQSKAEDSLSVSLPADLSVDTPPISLWPPLPSPHNSSNPMITHFPPGHPHFPFYDMNPMLRAPIFAYNPHDESGPNQSQSQKAHSGLDSFYGPPTGFTGPFISPPGGIPGVQGPPHMVVYNHFSPVGQFGQVGLSFMGTTYIPSGKQPDWKHSPVSSSMVGGDGEANSSSMASSQRNPTIVPASVQHLAPGSALLPLPSPLAMFDVSPFQAQSSPDMPVQARWPHISPSPLQPPPPSMPLQQQQQPEAPLSSQFSNNVPANDQSSIPNRYLDIRTSTPSDSSRNFLISTVSAVTRLPNELVLPNTETSSLNTKTVTTVKSKTVQNTTSSGLKLPQTSQQKTSSTQQYGNSSSGYNNNNHQRGSQRNEWSHRRSGFHGRNQSMGGEKGFPNTKVKQIYVAKQTSSSSTSTTAST